MPAKSEANKGGMLRTLEVAHFKQDTLREVTDVEWDVRVRDWDRERQQWIQQMVDNSIWAMGSPMGKTKEKEPENNPQSHDQIITLGPRHFFGLDPKLLHGMQSEAPTLHGARTQGQVPANAQSAAKHHASVHVQGHRSKPNAQAGQMGRPFPKHKKLSRLELLKFVADWDKASFGRRDMILVDFIKCYKTKENIYDSDALFHCGGSLIFSRFVISLQMSFLKHRTVWHYFEALSVFVRSLQSDRYTEEFLRLGGLGFICEVIRVEASSQPDKIHACKFLVDMMKGRKSIAVKMFICDNPHFLESLVDSLTMCKDKRLIGYCGLCFENLCLESTIQNILVVTTYVLRLLPCDFNPSIQSMGFRVLQSVVRTKPSVGAKCVKPILDNLKTDDMDLLVEMSNLSLVILQTKYGPDLINQLMVAAEGIFLKEEFLSNIRPAKKGRQTMKDQDMEKMEEEMEKQRQKLQKADHYLQQAGALFLLNRMMTNKIEFVPEFTKQGIFGLSLKTLGSCPHWEVQGQGVTMIQFLHAMSVECAVSYFLMLPEKMMLLILDKPAECLRYFTSPICVLLRKLGRFTLKMWNKWLKTVVIPAQAYSEGGMLPSYFIGQSKMTRKVHEIQTQIAELLENPVMECFPKTPDESSLSEEAEDVTREFITDDEEDLEDDICQYRSGKEALFEGKKFQPFREFLDFHSELSDDKLDIKVDKSQPNPSILLTAAAGEAENELGAYEQALLQDAEKKKPKSATEVAEDGDQEVGQSPRAGSLETEEMDKEE